MATWYDEVMVAGEWQGANATFVAPVLAPGGPFSDQNWTLKKTLWEGLPHPLSLVTEPLGPVVKVAAVPGSGPSVYAALAHEGGAVSTVAISLTADNQANHVGCSFWGPGGFRQSPPLASTKAPYQNAIDILIASIATKSPNPLDVRFGAANVNVIAEVERRVSQFASTSP